MEHDCAISAPVVLEGVVFQLKSVVTCYVEDSAHLAIVLGDHIIAIDHNVEVSIVEPKDTSLNESGIVLKRGASNRNA